MIFHTDSIDKHINLDEYAVCQRRGHVGNGTIFTDSHTWQMCKYCHTQYYIETTVELIEKYHPDGI